MVGHDPTSGEVHHYTYPPSQSAFLPQVMTATSGMPAAQQMSTGDTLPQPPDCMPTPIPSAAALGAGDASGSMIPAEGLLSSSHHSLPDTRRQGMLSVLIKLPHITVIKLQRKMQSSLGFKSFFILLH